MTEKNRVFSVEALLTTTEAARMLGVSSRMARHLAGTGQLATAQRLPGAKGARLFTTTEVERLRREREAA